MNGFEPNDKSPDNPNQEFTESKQMAKNFMANLVLEGAEGKADGLMEESHIQLSNSESLNRKLIYGNITHSSFNNVSFIFLPPL